MIEKEKDMELAEAREALEALGIEYHCPEHGVVRNVPREKQVEVQQLLEYFFGHGCCTWTKARGKRGERVRDVEFINKTKVYPPPKKVWEWCGHTVLFSEAQDQSDADIDALDNLSLGLMVEFEHKGVTHEGIVIGLNGRRASVLVDDVRWRVPGRLLRRWEAR